MKRYQIKLKGYTTEDKWVVVFECNLKSRLLRHYKMWYQSYHEDHQIVIEDTRNQTVLDK